MTQIVALLIEATRNSKSIELCDCIPEQSQFTEFYCEQIFSRKSETSELIFQRDSIVNSCSSMEFLKNNSFGEWKPLTGSVRSSILSECLLIWALIIQRFVFPLLITSHQVLLCWLISIFLKIVFLSFRMTRLRWHRLRYVEVPHRSKDWKAIVSIP